MTGWHDFWPLGWLYKVISRGLTWPWVNEKNTKSKVSCSSKENKTVDHPKNRRINSERYHIFVNHVFKVPKRYSVETRLVLDVSKLNNFLVNYHFHMTTATHVRLALFPRAFMASIDI